MTQAHIKTTALPTCACPLCGYRLDRASDLLGHGAVPKPGDISFCLSCGAINAFANDLTVHVLSPAAIARLEAEMPELQVLRVAWRRSPDMPLARGEGHGLNERPESDVPK